MDTRTWEALLRRHLPVVLRLVHGPRSTTPSTPAPCRRWPMEADIALCMKSRSDFRLSFFSNATVHDHEAASRRKQQLKLNRSSALLRSIARASLHHVYQSSLIDETPLALRPLELCKDSTSDTCTSSFSSITPSLTKRPPLEMSTTKTNRGLVSRRASLPPAILRVLKDDDSGRRHVLARITRRNKCVDCDYLGAAARDLKAHYRQRASHGFVTNGPREECFLCGERFCMRQTLDGHHKVMHTAKGPFAKLRASGITLPGETAAQSQTPSTATATATWSVASVRSGQSGPPASMPTTSPGADPLDSAIDQERDHQTEQCGFGESIKESEAYAPHTSAHTPNQSTSQSTESAGLGLFHQFMAADEHDHQSGPPQGGDLPVEYKPADTSSTYPPHGVEQRRETTATRRSDEDGDEIMAGIALLDAFDEEDGNWDVDFAGDFPDLTGGPTPAESSEATTPHSMDDTSPDFGSQTDNGYKQATCTPACVGNDHAQSCFLWLPDF